MTTWGLTLRVDRLDEGASTPVTEAAIASMSSPDPRTVAAVLRATADQLDPPKPPRPAYRSSAEYADAMLGTTSALRGPRPAKITVKAFRQDAKQGLLAVSGVEVTGSARLTPAKARALAAEITDCADAVVVAARDANGLPNYAHDVDCNTIHDAGPEPCPPPRIATPAQIDAMVCPDCIGDAHTYETGRCALKPPWNRAGVPVGTVGEPAPNGFAVVGYEDATPLVVDVPGDRMDAPDAPLSTRGARRHAPGTQDVLITSGPLAGMHQRRTGSRITPDGCGPEHTFTGSCHLAVQGRPD